LQTVEDGGVLLPPVMTACVWFGRQCRRAAANAAAAEDDTRGGSGER